MHYFFVYFMNQINSSFYQIIGIKYQKKSLEFTLSNKTMEEIMSKLLFNMKKISNNIQNNQKNIQNNINKAIK